jgi:curved DNA-binding protein
MSANGYRDYFKVLGVDRGADADAIKRAFRKLARQYHPDVNPGNQEAEAKFKEISEAYEVLSDPDKRRRYEQFGQYWSQAGGGGATGGFDVDFGRYGNFDDFINDLLGRFAGPGAGAASGGFGFGSGFPGGFAGGGGFGGPGGFGAASGFGGRATAPNLDAEASINLTLAEAFRGCERTLAVNDERVQVRIPPGVKNGCGSRARATSSRALAAGGTSISISSSRAILFGSSMATSCAPSFRSASMSWPWAVRCGWPRPMAKPPCRCPRA